MLCGYSSGDRAENLVELRKAVLALLREDDAAVGDDVELGALAGDCTRRVSLMAELLGEAHGPPVVPASDGAVEDLDPGHRPGRYLYEASPRDALSASLRS